MRKARIALFIFAACVTAQVFSEPPKLPVVKAAEVAQIDQLNVSSDRRIEKLWTVFVAPALTLLLLAMQVWIYSRQRKLMQAAIDMERPYVYGSVSEPGLAIAPSGSRCVLTKSVLQLCIFNIGKTPANFTRLDYSISTAPHGSIAPAIDPSVAGGRELPVGTIAIMGDPFFETEKLNLRFIGEESDIVSLKKTVWIVGFVRYSDIFGHHHISGFALAFDPLSGRFVRRGGEKYNYSRNEKRKAIPTKSA